MDKTGCHSSLLIGASGSLLRGRPTSSDFLWNTMIAIHLDEHLHEAIFPALQYRTKFRVLWKSFYSAVDRDSAGDLLGTL